MASSYNSKAASGAADAPGRATSSGPLINFNGALLPANSPLLTADNRGFRYGDGLFETLFVQAGRIRLGEYHFDRLFTGMRLLRFDIPPFFTEKLTSEIIALSPVPSRVRLVIFRGEGSLIDPLDATPNYIIQSWPLVANPGGGGIGVSALPPGLHLGIYTDGRKACDALSNLKSNNFLLYTLAADYARQQGFDDCLVLNSHDRLADSTIANLFYIRNGEFYTPPLSEGVVAGVMRRHLLEALPKAGYAVHEQPVPPADLLIADEVFVTNAIRGIRPVSVFQGKSYGHSLSTTVYEQLIKSL